MGILSALTGCAGALQNAGNGDAVDLSCVVTDDRLGLPFRDPAKALEWLDSTAVKVEAMGDKGQAGEALTPEDLATLRDLADLASRAAGCLRR